MQQQYRAQKFTKFLDLISVLLIAEKQNYLFMKKNQARPTGLNTHPEAHVTNSSSHNRQKPHRGHGNGCQAPPRAQGQPNRGPPKGGNLTRKRQPLVPKALTSRTRAKLPFNWPPLN
ncbi:hypothetical protein ACFX19_047117 [Malus domestica]